jgi:hypothetical protein
LACVSGSEGGQDGEKDEDSEQVHRSGRHIKVSSIRGSSSVADPEGTFWPNPIRNINVSDPDSNPDPQRLFLLFFWSNILAARQEHGS